VIYVIRNFKNFSVILKEQIIIFAPEIVSIIFLKVKIVITGKGAGELEKMAE